MAVKIIKYKGGGGGQIIEAILYVYVLHIYIHAYAVCTGGAI